MKRFLICAIALLLILAGGYYLLFFEGVYLELSENAEAEVPFRSSGKQILRRESDGSYSPMQIRGVDVGASMPGSYFSDFAPDEEDYARWFAAISEMGANTVRASTIMDADFYNALYAHNTGMDAPLYLLQGIQVSDEANYGAGNAYEEKFMGSLIEDGMTAVDVIHGRRVASRDGMIGSEAYFSDVSPWVIGYLVGSEWSPDAIVCTDHTAIGDYRYQGDYFVTSEDATPFECIMAEVMDRIVRYEDSKYRVQRMIGFVSAPDVDFLIYEETSARIYDKYACVDAEHVLPTERYESGCYAGYRLFDYCRDFAEHIAPEQKAQFAGILNRLKAIRLLRQDEPAYGGYLDFLSEYHTMPVIAAGYGFSSSRGVTRMEQPPLTEEEQGQALVRVWEEAVKADWAGVFISSWQDSWERRTWNVSFATELTNNLLWHDVQCDGQNYGLMAYVPLDGEDSENPVCLLDGATDEWAADEAVVEADGMKLYVRHDREYLYLMVEGEAVDADSELYLPIDMNDALGSTVCAAPQLEFEQAAEFVLCLDGTENSRLLVHERYDAAWANFAYDIEKIDPYIRTPDADSTDFGTAFMAATVHVPAADIAGHTAEELRDLNAFAAYPTGQLVHGDGNPDSDAFCSLADFCYGTGCAEVRIPWLLLNVADPTGLLIHKDYYENYGVEFASAKSWRIGLGDGNQVIEMADMTLKPLSMRIRWEERLKKSYYVVQNAWKQEELP